ncbi:UDP-glucose 4-epimerase GalE [Macrococcus capreoli]|uniref:UDP-glucose 4-epimerase GalE n=1 Tax=Macrococcus capreoli TaxID=2982690 RepID=UPI003EE6CEAA
MKTILVTGGAGYIGSHTVIRLINNGYRVIVADDLSTGSKEAVDKRAKFYECDIYNKKELSNILSNERIDGILHCAGKIVVAESIDNPLKYFENNVVGLKNVLDVLVDFNIKNIIFSSTASVYGNNAFNVKATEDTLTAPTNPYAESKLIGERMIMWTAKKHNLNYVIFRYFNVAGAMIDASNGLRTKNPTHLIPSINSVALGKKDKLEIFGDDYDTLDGTCIRDFIHVNDLAKAHQFGFDYLFKNGSSDIFNLGSEKGYSVKNVYYESVKLLKTDIPVVYSKRREGDPDCVLANISKVKEILHWEPEFNLEDIILSDFNWRKKLLCLN